MPPLLVRGEADAQLAVGHLRVGLEILHQGHDLGHAGLVVRPQEGGAVGDDQVLPQVLVQTLVYVGAHGHAQGLVEDDGPAVVVLHDPGPDPRAAGLGGGVHMGDQAQGHPLPTLREVGREGPHDVAVPVHTGVLHTQGPELLRQEPGQIPLALGAGDLLPPRGGLSVDGHVPEKTFLYPHFDPLLMIRRGSRPPDVRVPVPSARGTPAGTGRCSGGTGRPADNPPGPRWDWGCRP